MNGIEENLLEEDTYSISRCMQNWTQIYHIILDSLNELTREAEAIARYLRESMEIYNEYPNAMTIHRMRIMDIFLRYRRGQSPFALFHWQ
jgi:hypothetical protein